MREEEALKESLRRHEPPERRRSFTRPNPVIPWHVASPQSTPPFRRATTIYPPHHPISAKDRFGRKLFRQGLHKSEVSVVDFLGRHRVAARLLLLLEHG